MKKQLSFEAPGEGPWELDSSHFERPFPRYAADRFLAGFAAGQANWIERVGVPMKGIELSLVHGMPYGQVIPLVGKPADLLKPPPPTWIFKIMMWLHPAMRRRRVSAESWLATRGWREDLRRWDEEVKPALLARFGALEAEALGPMTDDELVDHLDRCGQALEDNLFAHFDTNPTTIVPVGAFLRRGLEWTSLSLVELLGAVRGTGACAPLDEALASLADALRAESDGPSLLNGGRTPVNAIAALREMNDDIGRATRNWLSLVEHRAISSGDLETPIGAEVPMILLDQVRRALDAPRTPTREAIPAETICAGAPEERREELAFWLEEARLVYRVRDERSTLCDSWAMGLVRRGLLEAGDRLVAHGRLHERGQIVDVDHVELIALMSGSGGLSADEVAARTKLRSSLCIDDAPHFLNADGPPPDPPLDAFTGATGEIIKSLFVYRDHMEKDGEAPAEPAPDLLSGLPASGGVYRGRARVIMEASDFGAVKPGEVLVARATMPAYNVLLPIIGAIVTDRGGALCHAAIVAREYGLPCVVGTRDATKRLADGDLIEVDGTAGTVSLIAG